MPGNILGTLYLLTLLILKTTLKVGATVIPALEMGKLSKREIT